ncbi:hypothetical protein CRH15_07380 [Lelliottia amnigena]|nr:hypothetical protein CO697_18390 [Lelliottia amnigena]PEG65652.1 hypothetical protein CRH15_07380 [Lelliottia amnigena]
MSHGAHKNPLIFVACITKLALARLMRGQNRPSHPPASSPTKKRGGGGFTTVMDAPYSAHLECFCR